MDTSKLKSFAQQARKLIKEGVKFELQKKGFNADGSVAFEPTKISGGTLFDLHDRIGKQTILCRQMLNDLMIPDYIQTISVGAEIIGVPGTKHAENPARNDFRIPGNAFHGISADPVSSLVGPHKHSSIPALTDTAKTV